ncbi:PGF-CTERM sorting domain-containing protein [Natronococcus pandeyae]|uniref:PGF-CTERM sorting domain-containing protein n=1 Tax=Natronococcus pandeyae TaxID=2055836 RepID=UPI001F2D51A1|nr:PGF-CTERM sorting domain-containing protein [Natronococcus pandeyae]
MEVQVEIGEVPEEGNFGFDEEFDPAFADVSLGPVEINGEFYGDTTTVSDEDFASWNIESEDLEDGDVVTAEYTVDVPEDAAGETYEISGEAVFGDESVETGTTEINVQEEDDENGEDENGEDENGEDENGDDDESDESAVDADVVFDSPDDVEDVWVGQQMAVGDLEDANGAEIREGFPSDDADNVETSAIDNGYATFDTSELEDDEPYHLVVHGDDTYDDKYGFWAYETNFEVEMSSVVSQVSSTDFSFDSDRDDGYDVVVSSDDLDEDELDEIFGADDSVDTSVDSDDGVVTLEGVGNADNLDADFSDAEVGEYNITFDVADTVDSDEATVEVTDEELDYEFVDVSEPAQGELGQITIGVSESDTAAVVLGDDDDGYVSTIELENIDDEEVTLLFNTHAAADEPWIVHEDSDAEIADQDVDTELGSDEAFPAYNWDLSVGDSVSDNEIDNEYDRDRLVVQDRTTPGDVSLETAPAADEVSDFDSYDDATVTATDSVADEDALIVTVDDFGAEGIIAGLHGDADLDDEGIVLSITEQESGPIGEPTTWSTDADDEHLDAELVNTAQDDYDGDLVFVVHNADELEVGDDYDVEFEITDDNRYVDDEDDEFSEELELSIVDRVVEWDAIESLPAEEDATANGTTTVAPGTELEANADSPNDEGGFVAFTDAVVTAGDDGAHVFSAEFDLAGEQDGVLFDLTVEDHESDAEDTLEDVELVGAEEPEPETYDLDVTVENEDGEALDADVTVDGESDWGALENGTYTVTADHDDYKSASEDVTIDGDDKSVTLTLEEEEDKNGEDKNGDDENGDDKNGDDENGDDDANGDDANGDDGDDEGEDDDSTPGFGVAVAVVALLAAAMLALRRDN